MKRPSSEALQQCLWPRPSAGTGRAPGQGSSPRGSGIAPAVPRRWTAARAAPAPPGFGAASALSGDARLVLVAADGGRELWIFHGQPCPQVLKHEHDQRGRLVGEFKVLANHLQVPLPIVTLPEHLSQFGRCLRVEFVLFGKVLHVLVRRSGASKNAILHLTYLHPQKTRRISSPLKDLPESLHVLLQRVAFLDLQVEILRDALVQLEMSCKFANLRLNRLLHLLVVGLCCLQHVLRCHQRVLLHHLLVTQEGLYLTRVHPWYESRRSHSRRSAWSGKTA
mmetsp:Transcript_48017/g.104540  ORF Transcript_48017/g.104540 Transcript_48017/m.104540 type:complete len:280 (-) Transcript_48017:189-1028(-)